MQDMFQGHEDAVNRQLADSMRYEEMMQQNQAMSQDSSEETELQSGVDGEETI